LQDYLDAHNIIQRDAGTIRKAVIAIRQNKLPDPKVAANNGSFFHNPIVSSAAVAELLKKYPEMPHFSVNTEQEKIPAAWLIDQAGFKGVRAHGIYVSDKQPLVLINETASSTKDLLTMRDEIITSVKKKFGISLQQEPELVTP
jgi:UDP-N-acetylmuramate dehydrogenase